MITLVALVKEVAARHLLTPRDARRLLYRCVHELIIERGLANVAASYAVVEELDPDAAHAVRQWFAEGHHTADAGEGRPPRS